MATRGTWQTIGQEIERLAQETGAPASFVAQMREFFFGKRIDLENDVEPYLAALQEAFLLEETVRRNTQRAKENLVKLQDCMRLVGTTYQSQLGQLRRVRDSLDQQGRLVREGAQRLREVEKSSAAGSGRIALSIPAGTCIVPGPTDSQ